MKSRPRGGADTRTVAHPGRGPSREENWPMDTWGDLVISGDVVRGSRIGAGPVREADHGPGAPRVTVSFWCANRHQTRPNFAADAAVPETWECPRCGGPAGQDERHPPARPRIEPFRTHLAYVKERRSQADGEAILAEALARLHGARQPFVPASPAEACAAADEGRPDPAGPRQAAAGDQRAPATAALPAAGAETRSGRDQDLPRPPGRPGAPGRRGAGGASSRSRPGRREDQGPRPAETAPCPGQPDANPDPLGADAPARPHPQPSLGPAPHA
ncbi:MAG: RNA polymerase-binding protein RbpA, partial [Streptosporangiaceae bacterium]